MATVALHTSLKLVKLAESNLADSNLTDRLELDRQTIRPITLTFQAFPFLYKHFSCAPYYMDLWENRLAGTFTFLEGLA